MIYGFETKEFVWQSSFNKTNTKPLLFDVPLQLICPFFIHTCYFLMIAITTVAKCFGRSTLVREN